MWVFSERSNEGSEISGVSSKDIGSFRLCIGWTSSLETRELLVSTTISELTLYEPWLRKLPSLAAWWITLPRDCLPLENKLFFLPLSLSTGISDSSIWSSWWMFSWSGFCPFVEDDSRERRNAEKEDVSGPSPKSTDSSSEVESTLLLSDFASSSYLGQKHISSTISTGNY